MTRLLAATSIEYVAGRPARRVSWLELFFDLVFVAAVAHVAAPLRHDFSAGGIVRFAVLFVLIWWAWTGHSVFANRFGADHAFDRALTLVQMFAVAVMAVNAQHPLGSRDAAGFAAAYALMRLVLVLQYLRVRALSEARDLATRYVTGHGIAAMLWFTSAFVMAPGRYVIWAVAMAIDLGTPWVALRHSVRLPPDAAHLPERFGLFTLILLGESVVAVMEGMESQEHWSVAAASAAFTSMAIAFLLWWWYFDGVRAAREQPVRTHADAVRLHLWSYIHLPLYLGIAITGVGLQRIVHTAGSAAPAPADLLMLTGALATVASALAALGAMRGTTFLRKITDELTETDQVRVARW